MIRKSMDVKLNVKPVFIFFGHKYYYEGPCRFAAGDALQPGFDTMTNGFMFQGMMEGVKANMPDCVNLLPEVQIEVSDDWDIKEEYFEKLFGNTDEVDVYLLTPSYGPSMVYQEFIMRSKKPVLLVPNPWSHIMTAGLANDGTYNLIRERTWPLAVTRLKALAAKKAISKSNFLLAPRFNYDIPVEGGVDSFRNLEDVTKLMGIHFRTINIHELLDELHPLTEEGNHTTPGKQTPNITEEEIAELEKYADELIAGAKDVQLDKDKLVKSLIVHKVVQKNMDLYDCNGVVLPCPDACSTRRLNKEQITFCFTHALNLEMGLPSSCEYDISAGVSMLALMTVSGKGAYMGNTLPMASFDGRPLKVDGSFPFTFITPEEGAKVMEIMEKEGKENLVFIQHSTLHRKMKGVNEPAGDYSLRHFAYDQKFGALFRYDYNQDIGQTITVCKFSSDLKKMFVGKGEIMMGVGYDTDNCNGGLIYKVDDLEAYMEGQSWAGIHVPLVYGDYTEELKMLAEEYGMQVLTF